MTAAESERQFSALVDSLAAHPEQRGRLTDLLREDHSFYDQRGTSATVRMRGWVLLALGRVGVSDADLLFVLEELQTGVDAYLVAAAAHALRSYTRPGPALARFLMQALTNIRYRDDPVSFAGYGEYQAAATGTSPVHELLVTLTWLGPHAQDVLPDLEALRIQRGALSRKRLADLDRAIDSIRSSSHVEEFDDACCSLPSSLQNVSSRVVGSRQGCERIDSTVFEDQQNELVTFKELFHGHPSFVVFFYTRCDNPLKCSLTVTKLARLQKLLADRGLADEIHTAAITYDPGFDLPDRLRAYGQNRGVCFDARNRMLRATGSGEALRRHFELGVNFVESLVNRHKVEAFLLDRDGRIAASFQRLHWNEDDVADRAMEVLRQKSHETTVDDSALLHAPRMPVSPVFATVVSFIVAFFPKCPVCWAAYLGAFGIAGLDQIAYFQWLQPLFVLVMMLNLGGVWLRARSTGWMGGFYLVSAGVLAIGLSKTVTGWAGADAWGVALILAGSLLSARAAVTSRKAGLAPAQVDH